MEIVNVAPQAFSGLNDFPTDVTGNSRVRYVEGLHMSGHVTLQFELLATIETPPDCFTQVILHLLHVRGDQVV